MTTEAILVDFINQISLCTAPDELNVILSKLIQIGEFDNYQFNLLAPSEFLKDNFYVFDNTPPQWLSRYFSENLAKNDPLLNISMIVTHPFFWKDISKFNNVSLSDENLNVMKIRTQFDMLDGVTFPIHSGQGAHGVLHLSAQKRIHNQYESIILISTIFSYLFNKACDLMTPLQPGLSEREKECLFWVSEGKTSWEVSRILGVSERTVNFHINNAINKTGCKNRYHAIARSIATGRLQVDYQRLNITNYHHESMQEKQRFKGLS